jgi:ABC-type branched-subunit amino acid transport system ATPase component
MAEVSAAETPASVSTPLVEVDDVVAGYEDKQILHGVSLTVSEREVVTIIGPNGAGKSTLLKVIMGYLVPESGTVLENVFPSLTVYENLRMGGYLLPRQDVGRRIEELYAEFPLLAERRRQRVRTLSGGQRQLLAIARALMTDPDVILLDEPSAALSPIMADEVFDKVAAIRDRGKAVLIVEQEAERALEMSHRGYLLVDGRNAFTDRAQSILQNERIRDAFLGGPVE